MSILDGIVSRIEADLDASKIITVTLDQTLLQLPVRNQTLSVTCSPSATSEIQYSYNWNFINQDTEKSFIHESEQNTIFSLSSFLLTAGVYKCKVLVKGKLPEHSEWIGETVGTLKVEPGGFDIYSHFLFPKNKLEIL